MTSQILGLDIGGANLKAATADPRAVSVPFALWKQPDALPAALAAIMEQFPDATELAVTMTGELCDCYETKRQGVNAILDAVELAGRGRPVRVWSTDGAFASADAARREHLKVAASNWHALATFAGRYVPNERSLLIDIGSTTTDIIPLLYGAPHSRGWTDEARLASGELVYVGVRRTPICAVVQAYVCAELFATTQDVYVALGMRHEEPSNTDTADGRALTRSYSLARLARMLGGDIETVSHDAILEFAMRVHKQVVATLSTEVWNACIRSGELDSIHTVILSGAGEFLARKLLSQLPQGIELKTIISLNAELGTAVSMCAPAYAVAVLAGERR